MDMTMDTTVPSGGPRRDDVHAPRKTESQDQQTQKAEEQTLIEQVREKGFTQFVKELEEKKKEELRAKILGAMGLSEEDLENMPAEQRAQIEDLIAREILERTAASAHMNGSTSAVVFQQTTMNVQYSEINVAATIASDMGLGPLLALQETDALKAHTSAEDQRKEDLLNG